MISSVYVTIFVGSFLASVEAKFQVIKITLGSLNVLPLIWFTYYCDLTIEAKISISRRPPIQDCSGFRVVLGPTHVAIASVAVRVCVLPSFAHNPAVTARSKQRRQPTPCFRFHHDSRCVVSVECLCCHCHCPWFVSSGTHSFE